MKRALLMLIGVGLLIIGGSLVPVSAKTIELSYNTGLPPFHVAVKNIYMPWSKMIEERTNGIVKINVNTGGSLCPVRQVYNCIEGGVVDMGDGSASLFPDRFPLSTVFDLPLLGFNSSNAACKAYWDLYQKMPEIQTEFSDVHLLWLEARPPYQIQTVKKPIRTLEDLKGLKIRCSGGMSAKVPPKLGAVPVVIPAPETYLSLERGVVDGSMFPWEGTKSFKLNEVVKYHTVVDLLGGVGWIVMNKDRWNAMPPDIQKVFDELSGEWSVDWNSTKWDEEDARAKQLCIEAGNEIYTLPEKEMERWRVAVKPIWEEWINEMEAKGLPGRTVLNEVLKLSEKYSK